LAVHRIKLADAACDRLRQAHAGLAEEAMLDQRVVEDRVDSEVLDSLASMLLDDEPTTPAALTATNDQLEDDDRTGPNSHNLSIPAAAWRVIRDESRSWSERRDIVLDAPSPESVKDVLLAALGMQPGVAVAAGQLH
jgi:hypothetical protein